MRKFLKDYSFTGVVLILCTFFLAIILRLFNLSEQGPWTDELASFFYLRNLPFVFYQESHSPLYYAVLRLVLGSDASVTSIRYFSSVLSIIHLLGCFILGKKVFTRNQFLLFWIFVCLNPLDIVYARMARHYAWFMESVLLFALWLRVSAPTWWVCFWGAILGFVHVFAIIPITLLSFFDYLKDKKLKRLVLIMGSASTVLIYYGVRFFMLGHQTVGKNVSWNQETFIGLLRSLSLQFIGDAYPRNQLIHLPLGLALAFLCASGLFFIQRKSRRGLEFFILTVASILMIEIISQFWVNLRISRYLVYLSPLLYLAITETWKEVKEWQLLTVLGLFLGLMVYSNPIALYSWDTEAVEQWRQTIKAERSQTVVCANPYQNLYYGLNSDKTCLEQLPAVDFRKPLYYFDLNNHENLTVLYLMERMRVIHYKKVNNSLIIFFGPK